MASSLSYAKFYERVCVVTRNEVAVQKGRRTKGCSHRIWHGRVRGGVSRGAVPCRAGPRSHWKCSICIASHCGAPHDAATHRARSGVKAPSRCHTSRATVTDSGAASCVALRAIRQRCERGFTIQRWSSHTLPSMCDVPSTRLQRNDVGVHRCVATGWTGVDTFTPLFPEGVSGIESLWSVLISFRLYPRPYPPQLGRAHFPTTYPYCLPHFV